MSEEEEEEDSPLTLDEWIDCDDPIQLLRHAVAYCTMRELSLFLAAVAERVWPHWNARHPEDWRPAWCIAMVRAWCRGEATVEAVLLARKWALAARDRFGPRGANYAAWCASFAAAMATAYAHDGDPPELWADPAEAALGWAAGAETARKRHELTAFFRTEEIDDGSLAELQYRLEAEDLVEEHTERFEAEARARWAPLLRSTIPWRRVRRCHRCLEQLEDEELAARELRQ